MFTGFKKYDICSSNSIFNIFLSREISKLWWTERSYKNGLATVSSSLTFTEGMSWIRWSTFYGFLWLRSPRDLFVELVYWDVSYGVCVSECVTRRSVEKSNSGMKSYIRLSVVSGFQIIRRLYYSSLVFIPRIFSSYGTFWYVFLLLNLLPFFFWL